MKAMLILKKAISSVCHFLQVTGFVDFNKHAGFRILLYHSVNDPDSNDRLGINVSLEDFYEQMKFLKEKRYNVLPLKELIHRIKTQETIPSDSVAITFDDGYNKNLTEILKTLSKYGFPATFFVTVDYIQGKTDTSRDVYWTQWSFLTQEELEEILKSGHDIGSHSITHRNLDTLPIEDIEAETSKSKHILQNMLNTDIDLFSYPHGKFNEEAKEILKKNGYLAACNSITGKNDWNADIFSLRRTPINGRDSFFEFKKRLRGCYDWMSVLL